jgi:hypothetical protein
MTFAQKRFLFAGLSLGFALGFTIVALVPNDRSVLTSGTDTDPGAATHVIVIDLPLDARYRVCYSILFEETLDEIRPWEQFSEVQSRVH